MRLTYRLMALCLIMAVTLPALATSSKSLFKKGQDAEARQDYVTAYSYYKQAFDQSPKDLSYRAAYERMRFQAAAALVHRGKLTRQLGRPQDALALFQQALEIDPALMIAQQEIERTKQMIEQQEAAPQQEKKPQPESALRRRIEEAGGPVELKTLSNTPITLKLTEDSTVVYQTIGKLAGINVLFDPDYTPRRIHIELNGVTLPEALQLVAMESKTFWRAVTPNTIFVVADTPAKRKEIEANAIKTFYLSNLSQPTELQDVVNTMRTLLEVQRITMVPSQAAIVVRGTPDQLALAEKIIDDLDKAKPEVVIEMAIMTVQRDKARQLGISPPTSVTVGLNGTVNNSTTSSSGSTGTTASNTINFNSLPNLGAKDLNITIPPATATALLTDSSTKLLQNPQIRALDGQKASLKIGQRVPVATGSYGSGLTAGIGVSALVNTQFQYIDVGVNIDVTPKVHQNGEISLKMALDVSAVNNYVSIGGISQPVIGQNKVEHDIRLKDGEINLLGGLLEDSITKSIAGWPVLAQIPILKYFFGTQNTEHKENEIVFLIVPHIVRAQELTPFNRRAIDIGTGSVISLHPAEPAPPAGTPPQAPSTAPQPAAPTATPGTSGPSPVSLKLDVPSPQAAVGSTVAVNVVLNGGRNIYSVPMQLSYDPKILELTDVENGNFLGQDGQSVALVHREDSLSGTLQLTATRPPNAGGVSGSGTVYTLFFKAKAPGNTALSVTRSQIKDALMNSVQASGNQASVTVQ
jgi:general secretion pathway protein D